jgi:hypothetical protein
MNPDQYLQQAQLEFEAAQNSLRGTNSREALALSQLNAGLIQLAAALRAKWKTE